MVFAAQPDVLGPFEYLLHYLPGIGWPAVMAVLWKAGRFLSKAEERALAAEASIKNVDATVTEVKTFLTNTVEHNKIFITEVEKAIENHKTEAAEQTKTIAVLIKGIETLQDTLDTHAKVVEEQKSVLGNYLVAVTKVGEDVKEIVEEAKHQSDVRAQQFEILRGLAQGQAVISTNQNNITQGFQRVVDQLISIVNANKV